MADSSRQDWRDYVRQERMLLEPVLFTLGYTLDHAQPHVAGERFLMQAVTSTSGKKLILLAQDKDGNRAVVKATREAAGKKELRHERKCRNAIHLLPFAYQAFASPQERFFDEREDFLVSIQEYIDQESSFLARPLSEQFSYALAGFKAQEGAHAATYEQLKEVRNVFGSADTSDYLRFAASFQASIHASSETPEGLRSLADTLVQEVQAQSSYIAQYANFLTHTDFVPHNFRIRDGVLYLLDYASLRFGNKHEGWARFLNFMTLHNPELESAFLSYFAANRADEELVSLRVMRLYRLCEILWYYVRTLGESEGDLAKLNHARVAFWSDVARAQLSGVPLSPEIRASYQATRDALRSPEERERQKDLH